MNTKEAKDMLKEVSQERDLLNMALTSELKRAIKWFRGKCGYSFGICHETSACGGVVVVKFEGSVSCVRYFEEYRTRVNKLAMYSQSDDARALRDLAELAALWIHQKQNPQSIAP